MTKVPHGTLALRDVRLPRALLRDAGRFEGVAEGDCLRGDLMLRDGEIAGMAPPGAADEAQVAATLQGRILLPRLTEPHCHLDKCHTVARLADVGGDLMAAGTVQRQDKATWTHDDIEARAARGLEELFASGCGTVRSHVDWTRTDADTGEVPAAWKALTRLRDHYAGRIDTQLAALLPLETFDDEAFSKAAVRNIAETGGTLGVFLFDETDKPARLRKVISYAQEYGLALDFHVDEGLIQGLDGLTAIARAVTESGFTGPVLCGHACSLANREGTELEEHIEAVRDAGLSIVALPATNLYLQGRSSGTPDRRGITRVRELAKAGVPILFGSDNVGDAFCPLGRHDPMHALHTGALTAHLDPPYGPWLTSITTSARRALGLPTLYVDEAEIDDLLVSEARHTVELIAGAALRPLADALNDR